MRHRSWLLAVLVVALSTTARDAEALVDFLRKLSGPGPFLGLNLLFPHSLSSGKVTRELNNENLATLTMLGVDTEHLSPDLEGFVTNCAHQRLLEREFGLSLSDGSLCSRTVAVASTTSEAAEKLRAAELEAAVSRFLNATRIELTGGRCAGVQTAKLCALLPEAKRADFESTPDGSEARLIVARIRLRTLDELILDFKTLELRERIRHFDGGTGGFFGGFRPIPNLDCPELPDNATCFNPINNWFFTLSLGASIALENDMGYPDGFSADKDVLWVSAFPAFEKRAFQSKDGRRSLFFQAGPAVHYFAGAGFDDFWKASIRGRVGVRFDKFYVGVQAEYFLTAFDHDEFGGNPEEVHANGGIVFGYNLTGK